jgi:hypothetical protein
MVNLIEDCHNRMARIVALYHSNYGHVLMIYDMTSPLRTAWWEQLFKRSAVERDPQSSLQWHFVHGYSSVTRYKWIRTHDINRSVLRRIELWYRSITSKAMESIMSSGNSNGSQCGHRGGLRISEDSQGCRLATYPELKRSAKVPWARKGGLAASNGGTQDANVENITVTARTSHARKTKQAEIRYFLLPRF